MERRPMIVKVQKPIMPHDAPCLVYDQYRRIEATVPLTDQLRQMLGSRLKIYCEATKQGPDIVFGKVVPDRGW
jgi:hypothetical protein